MEFLDKYVLPQSAHHMILLKYLMALALLIFIPYISLLIGSLTFSLVFKNKSAKNNNAVYYKFSKFLIDLTTFNKVSALGLGLAPLLSISFGVAQLLHLSDVPAAGYILLSSIFYIAAIIFIYTFKYSFHLRDILGAVTENENIKEEIKEESSFYLSSANKLLRKSGFFGLALLLVSVYLFVGALNLTTRPELWDSGNYFINLIFSLQTVVGFLQIILFAFGFTAAFIIYRSYSSEAIKSDEKYFDFIKNFGLKTGLVISIILPLFIILSIMVKSNQALSYNLFAYTLLALFVVMFISVLFYLMIRDAQLRYASSLVYLFVLAVFFVVMQEYSSLDTATKKQFAFLAANYDEYKSALEEEYGLKKVVINGADIYNGKCIACHQFDKKLVGPPYNETLPKYEGKKEELVKFILNPVKINPDYPAMPNQGLKPAEAEAVADYLLSTYKK
ncbi:MAG: c-type cytochrome [Melioribacter sp.]|uniref:c-type cytochrome n=1 Tax=Melioribacter sp. TaxID=2052167 RepID=UPI003BCE30E6